MRRKTIKNSDIGDKGSFVSIWHLIIHGDWVSPFPRSWIKPEHLMVVRRPRSKVEGRSLIVVV